MDQRGRYRREGNCSAPGEREQDCVQGQRLCRKGMNMPNCPDAVIAGFDDGGGMFFKAEARIKSNKFKEFKSSKRRKVPTEFMEDEGDKVFRRAGSLCRWTWFRISADLVENANCCLKCQSVELNERFVKRITSSLDNKLVGFIGNTKKLWTHIFKNMNIWSSDAFEELFSKLMT